MSGLFQLQADLEKYTKIIHDPSHLEKKKTYQQSIQNICISEEDVDSGDRDNDNKLRVAKSMDLDLNDKLD